MQNYANKVPKQYLCYSSYVDEITNFNDISIATFSAFGQLLTVRYLWIPYEKLHYRKSMPFCAKKY